MRGTLSGIAPVNVGSLKISVLLRPIVAPSFPSLNGERLTYFQKGADLHAGVRESGVFDTGDGARIERSRTEKDPVDSRVHFRYGGTIGVR